MNKGDLLIASKWVGLLFAVFLLTAAGADRVVVIEDWLAQAVSRKGIPSGSKGEAFGQRADYDFTIEQATAGGIHLQSRDEHSTIARDITGKVNLKETPISGMDLEGDHSPDGRRLTAERNHGYGSPLLTSYGRGFPNSFARGLLDMSGMRRLRSQRLCRARRPGRSRLWRCGPGQQISVSGLRNVATSSKIMRRSMANSPIIPVPLRFRLTRMTPTRRPNPLWGRSSFAHSEKSAFIASSI